MDFVVLVFEGEDLKMRLDLCDVKFVDVIYIDVWESFFEKFLGLWVFCGYVDFYLNDGK